MEVFFKQIIGNNLSIEWYSPSYLNCKDRTPSLCFLSSLLIYSIILLTLFLTLFQATKLFFHSDFSVTYVLPWGDGKIRKEITNFCTRPLELALARSILKGTKRSQLILDQYLFLSLLCQVTITLSFECG